MRDRVNQHGITYELCSVAIGGSVISIYIDTVSIKSTIGVNWLTLCQECRRAVVLGPLLFLLYTSELFSILENKLIGYADLNRDLVWILSGVTFGE